MYGNRATPPDGAAGHGVAPERGQGGDGIGVTRSGSRRSFFFALACAGVLSASGPASAQEYPARALRLVVPYPPGGNSDATAREIAKRLSERLGRAVVVDNRPGASTVIGSEIVARSAADGYTLLMAGTGHAINASVYRLPYDTLKDFAPVSLLSKVPFVLVVHPSLPVKSLHGFIELARARPGLLAFGSSGNASSTHLAMELLKATAQVDLVHVPYKGAAPALVDLVSGQIAAAFDTVLSVQPHVRSGRLRALAASGATRSAAMPELSTIAEAGLPGYEVTGWNGIVTTGGAPRAMVERLGAEVAAIARLSEVRQRFAQQGGGDLIGSTPDEFAAFIRSEVARWAKVVREARIEAQ
jgi:tripartite-type tricarboxylate transporter receptor subunit TctC